MLLAAPVAAATAAGLWKPTPKVQPSRFYATMRIDKATWGAVHPKKDAFEAYITHYHQRLVVERQRHAELSY